MGVNSKKLVLIAVVMVLAAVLLVRYLGAGPEEGKPAEESPIGEPADPVRPKPTPEDGVGAAASNDEDEAEIDEEDEESVEIEALVREFLARPLAGPSDGAEASA